jgi:hypothetical protein
VFGDEAEQCRIASLAAGTLQLANQPAIGIQDRGGVGVAVGVDPDDGIDLAF